MIKTLFGIATVPAAALVLGASIWAGPAGNANAQNTWTGSSSAEDLLYRLQVLDAEIADIRARLGGAAAAPRASGGTFTGDAGAVEAELQRMTAKLERIENAQRQLANDLTRRLGDIEFRLNELEGNPGGGQVQPLAGSGNTFNSGGTNLAATSVSEQGDLDRAASDVRQGRFDQAEDRLRRFLNDYPGSPLAGEAWYWMGESQFVRGIHVEAARSYLNGYNSDRRGAKAPHNLYRLGVALGRLGQINEACSTLREVGRQFPSAPENLVGKADAEADNLTCG